MACLFPFPEWAEATTRGTGTRLGCSARLFLPNKVVASGIVDSRGHFLRVRSSRTSRIDSGEVFAVAWKTWRAVSIFHSRSCPYRQVQRLLQQSSAAAQMNMWMMIFVYEKVAECRSIDSFTPDCLRIRNAAIHRVAAARCAPSVSQPGDDPHVF